MVYLDDPVHPASLYWDYGLGTLTLTSGMGSIDDATGTLSLSVYDYTIAPISLTENCSYYWRIFMLNIFAIACIYQLVFPKQKISI